MAERRMFTKKITDDDHFVGLSSSAQALYLHLSMSADDDGFSNQISSSMFKAHASTQDLQALLENRYIYQFENGVIVIKHWRMANALRRDRYTQTAFKEQLAMLAVEEDGAYTWATPTENDTENDTDGCRLVATWLPQDRLGKDRLNNNNTYAHSDTDFGANDTKNDTKIGGGEALNDTKKTVSNAHDDTKIDAKWAEFWAAYPKKLNKKKAYAAFKKVKPDDELFEQMMASLEAQKKSTQWTKDGGQFIPYASSWLNGERWEDKPDTTIRSLEGHIIDADEAELIPF